MKSQRTKARLKAWRGSCSYTPQAVAGLYAPLTVEINPAIWQVLRDNPGLKLNDRGGMTLVPR